MRTDLNQMAIFASVVKHGSFTAAARALAMPKSTVSKRVAELEDRLGTRLLQRTTRSVQLTHTGSVYYEQCQRIIQEAEAAELMLTEQDGPLRGQVRVTAPWLMAGTLAPVMERFLLENPNVSLQLWLTDQRVDLIEEGFDLAIRAGALPDSSLVARQIGGVEHRICASAAYLLDRPAVRRPADLRKHDCIGFQGARAEAVWSFERRGEKVSVPVSGRYAVSSVSLVHRGVMAGLGVAHLPEFLVKDDLAAGRLVRLLPDWTIGRGGVYLVYPSSRNLSPRVRLLVDLLATTFAEDRPWSSPPPSEGSPRRASTGARAPRTR